METYNIAMQAVSTLGFPIVMSFLMFWKMNKQDKDHKEEMAHMTEALNNNTAALAQLAAKIGLDIDTCE